MGRTRKILQYEHERMESALEDVKRGMAVATAAKKHGVPRTTLIGKVNGKVPLERKMGPSSILMPNEEKNIVIWINHMARCGFPVTKKQVLDSVQHLIKELDRKTIFKDGRPGRTWIEAFLRRNPSISLRTPENLTTSRASVSLEILNAWFNEVFNHLAKVNQDTILNDPIRVFNGDESAFFLNPKGSKVLAKKGDKQIYQQVNPDEKECLTVLITANAAGDIAPPSIVFRYERVPSDICHSVPPSWGIGKSETGWMNSSLFYEYLANIFHPWLLKKKIPLPVILFVDGHSSHLTLHSSEFCDSHGIILIALYPNATHILQPMDVSVFRSLKGSWREKVKEWRTQNHTNPILKKRHFAPLLKEALDELPRSAIVNGFRKCGLVPWNPNAINYDVKKTPQDINLQDRDEHHQLNQYQSALSVIEETIGGDKVKLFQTSRTTELTVEDDDRSLFELWKKLKDYVDVQVQQKNLAPHVIILDNASGPQECTSNGEEQVYSSKDSKTQTTATVISPPPSTINIQSTTSTGNNLPSPFKRVLCWPAPPKKKDNRRESYPGFVLSESWRDYYQNKQTKKNELDEMKKKRAAEREKKTTGK